MTVAEVSNVDVPPRFGVHSEVGKLRRVMVHRPDLELQRLTPTNHDDLLFDDVMWVRRARQQHDAFADLLRDRGRRGPVSSRPSSPRPWPIPEARSGCSTAQ